MRSKDRPLQPTSAMTLAGLARNLAQTLAHADWSEDGIRRALVRRLPAGMGKSITSLSTETFLDLPGIYAPPPATIARTLAGLSGTRRIYAVCARRGIWPDPDLELPLMRPVGRLQRLDLPALVTPGDLAEWLFLTPERLSYLTDISGRHEAHGDRAVNHYNYQLVAKSSGGQRLVEAPKATLKSLQRQVLRRVLQKVPPHGDAFGFVPGRSAAMAAGRHANEACVICFDLRNFFPSIGAGRVFGLFRSMGYPYEVARLLTALCCTRTPERVLARLPAQARSDYRAPHLPQGAPTSPALSNLIAYRLDLRLAGLARRLGLNYSRYADDLSFSGPEAGVAALLRAVPEIVADEGFAVNPRKTRVMRAGARQQVTGIVVNQHLNVPRADYDQLKAILHACAKPDDHRLNDARFRAHLAGRIGWVAQLNPARGLRLYARLEAALPDQ